jgi:peroxiredoxin-like protein
MSIVKTFRFPVEARWFGGRLVRLHAPGKHSLRVATPPEFKGGMAGIWSPEDLLVGAVASCYELTLVAIAERRRVPLHTLAIDARGHVERHAGRFEFSVIELDVDLTTDAGLEREAEAVARLAQEHCIVGRALEVPVHVRVDARAASLAQAMV